MLQLWPFKADVRFLPNRVKMKRHALKGSLRLREGLITSYQDASRRFGRHMSFTYKRAGGGERCYVLTFLTTPSRMPVIRWIRSAVHPLIPSKGNPMFYVFIYSVTIVRPRGIPAIKPSRSADPGLEVDRAGECSRRLLPANLEPLIGRNADEG